MVSRRFRGGFAAVLRRFRCGFAAVSLRFRYGFAWVSLGFRLGFAMVIKSVCSLNLNIGVLDISRVSKKNFSSFSEKL